MNQIIIRKLEELCFMGMIVFLPLGNIPIRFRLINTLHSLPFLCCLIGMFLIFIENCKYNKSKSKIIEHKAFWAVYVAWPILCILIGSIRYPYFSETNMGSAPWIPQLKYIFGFLHGSYLDAACSSFLFIYRDVKEELFPMVAGVIFVTHLYRNDWKRGVRKAMISSCILVILCSLYSIPEMIWLWTHNSNCEAILKSINVYLYDVPLPPAWHPPLLWFGQLRSLFDEPSSLGIIGSFLFPLLLLIPEKNKNWYAYKIVLCTFFLLMILMTQSRTAVCLLLGELLLLIVWGGITRNKNIWKILLCSIFLSVSIYNIAPTPLSSSSIPLSDNYITRNIQSVASSSKRSNGARYGMTVAAFRVGLEHPVFGVGRGFESLYMEEVLPEFAKENEEIQGWMANSRSKGITKMGCFILNQYTEEFATGGIIGIVIFLIPPLFLLHKAIRKGLWKKLTPAILIVTLIGQLAAMFSGPYWITYPIIIGLLFCCINDNELGCDQ